MQSVKTYLQEKNRIGLLYILGMTVLSILYHGYLMNTGDQGEHLPALYQRLDPELYPHDFFMEQFHLTFSVRTYLIWLLHGLSLLTGVAGASFILFIICRFMMLLAWMNLTALLTGRQAAAYLLIPLLIILGNIAPGGNGLMEQMLTSNTPANMLVSWGIYYFFKQRYPISMILLGLASCFQVLTGIQIFLVLILAGAFDIVRSKKFTIKEPLTYLGWYVLFAAPMLVPQFYHAFLLHYPSVATKQFYESLYYQRAPWHYIPSSFPLRQYLFYLLLQSAGISASLFNGIQSVRKLYPMYLIILSGCLLYYIGLEQMDIMFIGKSQWFKSTMWLNGFSCMMISSALVNRLRIPQLSSTVIQSGLVLFNIFGLVCLFFPALFLSESWSNRYMIGHYHSNSLQEVHAYIRQNVAKDAVFMIAPDNESFGCEAQRSVPVNYKSVIHEVPYFAAWRLSMQEYYAVDFNQLGKNPVLPMAMKQFESQLNSNEYICDYAVVDLTRIKPDTTLWREVFKSGDHALLMNLRLYRDFAIRH